MGVSGLSCGKPVDSSVSPSPPRRSLCSSIRKGKNALLFIGMLVHVIYKIMYILFSVASLHINGNAQ